MVDAYRIVLHHRVLACRLLRREVRRVISHGRQPGR